MAHTVISGPKPGILDPSQTSRLLKTPDSTLSFASFDPLVASPRSNEPNLRNLSLDGNKPRRIVIETSAHGRSSWRFVPKAPVHDGSGDEGTWPRDIDICGQRVYCSQDQWDIYKLDPAYDCYVRTPPELTTVTPSAQKSPDTPVASATKRRVPTVSPEREMPPPKNPKRTMFQTTVYNVDEEEEEPMLVDNSTFMRPRMTSERAQKLHEKLQKSRQERREMNARRHETLNAKGASNISPTLPPEAVGKRKVSSTFDLSGDPERHGSQMTDPTTSTYTNGQPHKRMRTVSPQTAKRNLQAKYDERARKKQDKHRSDLYNRQKQREQQWINDLFDHAGTHSNSNFQPAYHDANEIPATLLSSDSSTDSDEEVDQLLDHSDDDIPMCSTKDEVPSTAEDEEAVREAALAESILRMRQLEADRPLWEEEARKRLYREQAEEQKRREETRRRLAEEALRAEQQKKAQERRQAQEARKQQDAQRREHEDAKKREHDNRRRQQQRYAYGPWTPQRALERYKSLCETFDATKYTPDEPLSFELVPWPVLHSPISFTVEDVDWGAVEKFFEAVRPHMRSQDYKTFVEKSHRRFHPDRWRSRGLLTSIADEEERGCIEVATNTVAQALTPIWREAKK